MAGCLRDGAPDAWGRRVILNRLLQGATADVDTLDELTYLLESGSDRIGALDFQNSGTKYEPRQKSGAPLEELQNVADLVEKGVPVTPELMRALYHGTSIGGARPKAAIEDAETKFIAKFSSSGDVINVVKAEFVAMRLAERLGLNVAATRLEKAAGKDVLLVRRFDRTKTATGWARRPMVSALTLLGLDEMMGRYASYQDFAEIIRARFTHPKKTLRELFSRLVFNVLCGNTDDHARNHAAFWDGNALTLTPAYDICPQHRVGREANQAMKIVGEKQASTLATCLEAAPHFHLNAKLAGEIVMLQINAINRHFLEIADEAKLSETDRKALWRRAFLNTCVFDGAPQDIKELEGALTSHG